MDDLTKNATLDTRLNTVSRRRPARARWALLAVVLVGAAVAGADVVARPRPGQHRRRLHRRAGDHGGTPDRGTVVALRVQDNQRVKAGNVLLEIDPRPYVVARDQAAATLGAAQAELDSARPAWISHASNTRPALPRPQAQAAAARATLTKADADWRRQSQMPHQATTQQEVDAANAARLAAQASLAGAEAELRRADTVREQLAQADASVQQLDCQGRAREGAACAGRAEPGLDARHRSPRRLDHQAQRGDGQLRPAWPGPARGGHAGCLGDREFQGIRSRPHAVRARRWTSASMRTRR